MPRPKPWATNRYLFVVELLQKEKLCRLGLAHLAPRQLSEVMLPDFLLSGRTSEAVGQLGHVARHLEMLRLEIFLFR